MQNKTVSVLSLLWLISGIVAGAAELPKIHYESEQTAPSVKSTGIWEKIPQSKPRRNPAATKSLAEKVSIKGFSFKWLPSKDHSRVLQSADLTDALLSEDGSLLVIAERIGGRDSNNSTRLVMVDLINRRVCSGFKLPHRRISSIAAVPGKPELILAVQEPQRVFNSKHKLLLIDLRRRAVISESVEFPRPLAAFASDGTNFYLALSRSQEILEGKIADFGGELKSHAVRFRVRKLFCYPESKTLLAVGSSACEYLSVRPDVLFLESRVTLPSGFSNAWMMAVPSGKNGAVAVNSQGRAIYITPGEVSEIPGRWSSNGCIVDGEQIFLGSVNLIDMKLISLPGVEVAGTYQPNALPPRNRNQSRFFFAAKDNVTKLIQVDERGNIFQIMLTGRRGRKIPILLVDKNGVR